MEKIENIPVFLQNMLMSQYGDDITSKIIEGYKQTRPVSLRVNTLKTTVDHIKQVLTEEKIAFHRVSWSNEAFLLENISENKIRELEIYKQGYIYLQSLSAMLPAIILNPKAGENILDMAAAPRWKNISNGSFI